MTCGWTGVCRPVFRKVPLLITESCRHAHFYDEFWRKTTHFLLFFANFWITHPCLWKICRKRDPCLENLGPKNPPIWAAHTRTLDMLCTPPPPGHECYGLDSLPTLKCHRILFLGIGSLSQPASVPATPRSEMDRRTDGVKNRGLTSRRNFRTATTSEKALLQDCIKFVFIIDLRYLQVPKAEFDFSLKLPSHVYR